MDNTRYKYNISIFERLELRFIKLILSFTCSWIQESQINADLDLNQNTNQKSYTNHL
jgi:hypothetical protein